VRLEGLVKLKKKKSNDLIGIRTGDFPVCSIAPHNNSAQFQYNVRKKAHVSDIYRNFIIKIEHLRNESIENNNTAQFKVALKYLCIGNSGVLLPHLSQSQYKGVQLFVQ
jgi:hypothetical protein